MSPLAAALLGIVQGLSEFLPISSSGHLILVPELFGWTELTSNDSLNKTFDVALHVGTLIAVLAYFRREVWSYVVAAWLFVIIVNLLLIPGYYDVALRDFGLMLGALALARLSRVCGR